MFVICRLRNSGAVRPTLKVNSGTGSGVTSKPPTSDRNDGVKVIVPATVPLWNRTSGVPVANFRGSLICRNCEANGASARGELNRRIVAEYFGGEAQAQGSLQIHWERFGKSQARGDLLGGSDCPA